MAELADVGSAIQERMRRLIVCPTCKAQLDWGIDEIRCRECQQEFRIIDGIPVLAADKGLTEHDELEHSTNCDHKRAQSAYFDRNELAEFEITRPRNSPGLYRWLLGEKFRRSISGIESLLPQALVLTVCGGSGMDGEFLAQRGACVIASDISLGAAKRCRERARRYGLSITSLVADVECLPFRDRSFDLVYVHDGLHHLSRPIAGLVEMTRVSAHAVSMTEPAQAVATSVAVRLGLAKEFEEAGNRVARFRITQLFTVLRSQDFAVVHRSRYAMYYPHVPGLLFSILSRPGLFGFVRWTWRVLNACGGRFGNKFAVVAVHMDGLSNSG